MITPLIHKEITIARDNEKRVLFFDPAPIYNRISVNRYKRIQSIPITSLFPKVKGLCGCGCGAPLTGRKTRWATEDCQFFAVSVQGIIAGNSDITTKYLRLYFGEWACCNCGVMDIYREYRNGLAVSLIQKDHIIPVEHGGGACWLSNYQLLCHDCHVIKTKQDSLKIKKPIN